MFGFPSDRHLLKVEPFLIRLKAATKGLQKALAQRDILKVFRGVDDTSFWVGRSIAEMISASESGEQNLPLFAFGLKVLLQAQITVNRAKKWVKQSGAESPVQYSDNSIDFVSPTGQIEAPIVLKKSRIKGAGSGVHTMTSIPKHTVISPCRVKIKRSGNFFQDWRSFPVAQKTNHSPFPNMTIIRKPHQNGLQGSYFVANRDIYPNEELTADYRDQGWAEYDYFNELGLPLDQWDANVYHSIGLRR